MICDICGITVGADNRVTVPPSAVVGPTRKGYVPSRLPPSWKPQCERLGISIASHWKTVVQQNSSVDWYLCLACKTEIDDFRQTGKVRSAIPRTNPRPTVNRLMWQCPKCGGILQKQRETLETKDKTRALVGFATCSYCSNRVPASTVYDGQFDFAESDDRIRQIGGDRSNMEFDHGVMRWRYKGQVVPLACDVGQAGASKQRQRKWWAFWK